MWFNSDKRRKLMLWRHRRAWHQIHYLKTLILLFYLIRESPWVKHNQRVSYQIEIYFFYLVILLSCYLKLALVVGCSILADYIQNAKFYSSIIFTKSRISSLFHLWVFWVKIGKLKLLAHLETKRNFFIDFKWQKK